ncbi:hypothetical protein HDU98_000152 [Podochytrium sp. JEL0797]|nr:hypothetical protein HDU98_000152 [Podochytrium sp. JEL0797]
MKVLIVGAGTVGPLLGVALHRAGMKAALFDAAATFTDIGGGFNLAPNGLRFAQRLGLLDKVYAEGTPLSMARIRTLDGGPVAEFSGAKLAQKYGTFNTGIKRSRFNAIGVQAAREEGVEIHNAKKLVNIEQTETNVTAIFADGTRAEGDILIGADGLRSGTRAILFGPEKPSYTGMDAIIGVTNVKDMNIECKPEETLIFQGKGTQFGIYGIGHNEVVWFIAFKGTGDGQESWVSDASNVHEQLLARLESLGAAPITREVVAKSERVLRYGIYDREPLKTWINGRCVLIGDAAHPMSPHLGQGANTALEDGGLLAELLKASPEDPVLAFQQFEKLRLNRTAQIVKSANAMGANVRLENPVLCKLRDLALAGVFAVLGGPPVDDMYKYDYVEVAKTVL